MGFRSAVVGACATLMCFVGAPAAAQAPPLGTVVEVQRGDTFSAIAGRFAGSTRSWSRVYDAKLSGLADPNRIVPGMRLELVADGTGRRYLRVQRGGDVTTAAAPTPAPSAAPTEPDTLVIGVLPFISASVLTGHYDNLKSYLERTGPQKVRIVVPANFKVFFDSTIRGDYDLAVSAPHFARVAQLDARMVPLAIYEPRIPAQFISTLDNPLTDAAAVRGKAVAFANPSSLVAMFGQQWLRQQNLEPGKDYEVRPARTDMGVGRMLLAGDAVAAVMSGGEFRALPPEESTRLKITEVFARIPNFIVVGHPRLGKERLANLKTRMLGFLADKDEGAAFAKATGLSGIVEVEESVLRELDPHVAATRRLMGGGN